MSTPEQELEWVHRLDPSRFNKATGAQYHTAPSIIPHTSPHRPKRIPKDAVTILFFIDETSWIGALEKVEVRNPEFQEGKPKTKTAKNGPVFALSKERALAIIPVKENYYWAANVLSKHKVVYASFVPNKPRTDGKTRKIQVIASFIPNEDEK